MANSAIQTSLGFLQTVLAADSTFTGFLSGGATAIYTGLAPEGTSPEWCILALMSSIPTLTLYGSVQLTRGLYQVKIVGPEQDYANIYNAYNQMLTDLALVRTTTGAYGTVLSCVKTEDLYMQEVVAGVPYINLGGLFRIEV